MVRVGTREIVKGWIASIDRIILLNQYFALKFSVDGIILYFNWVSLFKLIMNVGDVI